MSGCKLHTTEPTHHLAAGLCAPRWCAARLCVIRLGRVEGHPSSQKAVKWYVRKITFHPRAIFLIAQYICWYHSCICLTCNPIPLVMLCVYIWAGICLGLCSPTWTWKTLKWWHTIKCCYNTVQYNMIFHTALHWLKQNINQCQITPHTLP